MTLPDPPQDEKAPCRHDVGARSFAAVENEQCPICLSAEVTRLRSAQAGLQEEKRDLEDRLEQSWECRALAAEADLAALQEELAEAKADRPPLLRDYADMRFQRDDAQQSLAALRVTLREYGQHKPECALVDVGLSESIHVVLVACTCGWASRLASLDGKEPAKST